MQPASTRSEGTAYSVERWDSGEQLAHRAAELIATAIAGGEDGDAGLFAFGRTSMLRRVVDWTSRLAP